MQDIWMIVIWSLSHDVACWGDLCNLDRGLHRFSRSGTRPAWDLVADDGNARVRIAPCGSKLCATNLWIKDTSKGEAVGDRLVMSLDRKSDTKFAGTAYDPKRDRSYAITMIVGRNSLTTRGCILGGLLCRDVNWTPAN